MSDISPSRRHLLVGAGFGAAALAVGAVPVLSGVALAQESSNLSGEDLALTLFHRSMELAFVAIYDEAIDKGLLDDEQTAQAVQFRTHHNEHAASATALAGVAVGPNQALITDFTRQVRGANTVDALFDVLFELESRSTATYLQACGTYELPRAANLAGAILSVEAQHATVIGQAASLPIEEWVPAFESVVGAFTPAEFPVVP
jgi:Ferritin-like domain